MSSYVWLSLNVRSSVILPASFTVLDQPGTHKPPETQNSPRIRRSGHETSYISFFLFQETCTAEITWSTATAHRMLAQNTRIDLSSGEIAILCPGW